MFGRTLSTIAIAAMALLQLVSAAPVVERGTKGPGIAYSPYTATGCKSSAQISADFAKLQGYGLVRLYGLDCDQVKLVAPVARRYGMQLFIGIWEVDQMQAQVNQLYSDLGKDWSSVTTVSIGNEFILSGKYNAAQMRAFTVDARSRLRALGFNGSVASVNVFYEVIQDPSLCLDQDIIAVNLHAYFDGHVKAEDCGAFVKEMVRQVGQACTGQTVLVTETGWPSKGDTNGVAVPSKANQNAAISSIVSAMGNNVILFTAFDDDWKQDNQNTFAAEKYWGILSS
ncbi:glycoside hydrolase superfamily [Peziza echinospora]|nr:glycoside hydrolase superfamily [Peziza echinospora]